MCCSQHYNITQVGRAKEKIAEAEKKKKRALDKFVAFVRTAEGLYASTTWDEFEDAFKEEEEFVAVSLSGARRVDVLDLLSSSRCGHVTTGLVVISSCKCQ